VTNSESKPLPWRAPLALVAALAACSLEQSGPQPPDSETVLGFAVALQQSYAQGTVDVVYPAGLLSDELGATIGAPSSYKSAEAGIVAGSDSTAETPWLARYDAIGLASYVLTNAPLVALSDSTRSGVVTLAYLFKAMSLGDLLQLYERVVTKTQGSPTPPFATRPAALSSVLALLDSALAQYRAVRPGSEFNTTVRLPGVDLRNTMFAMQARYRRLAGDDAGSAAAADSVSRSVLSVLPSSGQFPNPIYVQSMQLNRFRPRRAWRAAVDSENPSDGRKDYHVTDESIPGDQQVLANFARYLSAGAAIPLYYPGEMLLVKAEALTRLADLAGARAALDSVITKCMGAAGEPLACLAAPDDTLLDTAPELATEIYRQRRFELFGTGLRWDDARRLESIGASGVARRCWLPYAQSERRANPNTPPDPSATLTTCY
jgi:hypothetical protein